MLAQQKLHASMYKIHARKPIPNPIPSKGSMCMRVFVCVCVFTREGESEHDFHAVFYKTVNITHKHRVYFLFRGTSLSPSLARPVGHFPYWKRFKRFRCWWVKFTVFDGFLLDFWTQHFWLLFHEPANS